MRLDQTLNWIGEPSKSQVERLRHRCLSELDYSIGMLYISEADYAEEKYRYIRKYMIPEEVYLNEFNWELLKVDCGMPLEANICGIGPNYIRFGEAANLEGVKEVCVDMYDKRYWHQILRKQYFYLGDEVYRWRNNYDIQEIFNNAYPDEWCEHKQKYQMLNSGYYPITDVLDKMQSIDSDFAKQYHEGTNNIFYESNW